MNIEKYYTITEDDPIVLAERVNDKLKEGFQVYGSAMVSIDEGTRYFTQVVVLKQGDAIIYGYIKEHTKMNTCVPAVSLVDITNNLISNDEIRNNPDSYVRVKNMIRNMFYGEDIIWL